MTEVTFWTNQSITANSALRSDNYSYDFSQLKLSPGEYRIYTAYRLNDGEYVITAPMSTMQHYVNLSVSDNGAYTFTNDPVAIKTIALNIPEIIGGYDLHSGFREVSVSMQSTTATLTTTVLSNSRCLTMTETKYVDSIQAELL